VKVRGVGSRIKRSGPRRGAGGTQVPEPESPRSRSRAGECDNGGGAEVGQRSRTFTMSEVRFGTPNWTVLEEMSARGRPRAPAQCSTCQVSTRRLSRGVAPTLVTCSLQAPSRGSLRRPSRPRAARGRGRRSSRCGQSLRWAAGASCAAWASDARRRASIARSRRNWAHQIPPRIETTWPRHPLIRSYPGHGGASAPHSVSPASVRIALTWSERRL
jgi:hypothetical protein